MSDTPLISKLAAGLSPAGLQDDSSVAVVSIEAERQAATVVEVLKKILERDPDLIMDLGWARHEFPIPDDPCHRSWGFYLPWRGRP